MGRRAATALLGVAIALGGCTRSKRPAKGAPPSPSVSVPAPVVIDAALARPPLPADVVRTRGAISASVTLDHDVVGAGEPLLMALHIDNTGPAVLAFDVGGDWFGPQRPLRFGWVVRDDSGAVVCQTPPPQTGMAGGGGGFVAKLAPGEKYQESLLLNPVCPGLMQPGRYRLTVTRVLTNGPAMPKTTPCDILMPPDVTGLAAGAPDPEGTRDATCMAALLAAPSLSIDFSLDITPYDPVALRTRLSLVPGDQSAAAKAGDNAREGNYSSYAQWFCEFVRCGCADDIRFQRTDDWLLKALAELPAALPKSCP